MQWLTPHHKKVSSSNLAGRCGVSMFCLCLHWFCQGTPHKIQRNLMLIEGSKLSVGANVTLNNISVLALQWTYPLFVLVFQVPMQENIICPNI